MTSLSRLVVVVLIIAVSLYPSFCALRRFYTSLYRRLRQATLFSSYQLQNNPQNITQWSKVIAATIAWYSHVGIYWAIYSRTFVTVRCCANYRAARFSDATPGGGAETCGAVLSSAELSRAETFSAGSWAALTVATCSVGYGVGSTVIRNHASVLFR